MDRNERDPIKKNIGHTTLTFGDAHRSTIPGARSAHIGADCRAALSWPAADTAGMRHKGEISLGRVKREWPHHVAIPADRVMGNGYDLVHGFAKTLSVGPRTYGFRRDDVDYVAFCFADPAHAEQFRERFDGERVN